MFLYFTHKPAIRAYHNTGRVCVLSESLSDQFSCVDKPYLCCWLHCRTVRPRCNTVSALSPHRTVCALRPLMASPSTRKRRTSPRTSLTLTHLLPSDFPPGVWAKRVPRQVGSRSGASSQATKRDMSNILGLLDLTDETVVVVEDEVLPERFCECRLTGHQSHQKW